MQGILFKQRYKPMNVPSTSILNRKHLHYIATRYGAVHNPGCSFGLFGRLPDMNEMDSIYSLEKAKEALAEVSKRRTLYRAVLSLDHETAIMKKFYNRSAWEGLLQKHIITIAKEMNIDARSMNWVAAYHHERGHPHVHIMYWDHSKKIRQEFIPKERFEVMTDKIKAAINRDLFGEEIRQAQTEQKTQRDAIQLELQALFKDLNLADALNLHQVKPAQLTQIGEQLRDLFLNTPRTGRLAYQFLPQDYKAQLDSCVDSILGVSGFKKLERRLIQLRDDVGTLYGNSTAWREKMRSDERVRLHKDMGNAILKHFRECRKTLSEDIFGGGSQELHDLQDMAENLLSQSPEIWRQYTELLAKMPRGETMLQPISEEEIRKHLQALAKGIREDMRIRTAIRAYADKQELPDDVEGKAYRRKFYSDCYASIDRFLRSRLYSALAEEVLPRGSDEAVTELRYIATELLQTHVLLQASYKTLLEQMPKQRTPFSEIMQGQFQDQFNLLCKTLREDIRIRTIVHAYALSHHVPPGENEGAFRKQYYAACHREISKLMAENLKTDAGYPEQAQRDLALDVLMHLFQMTSQDANHRQSQRLYDRYQRGRSKAAQKDYMNEKSQDSGWEFG